MTRPAGRRRSRASSRSRSARNSRVASRDGGATARSQLMRQLRRVPAAQRQPRRERRQAAPAGQDVHARSAPARPGRAIGRPQAPRLPIDAREEFLLRGDDNLRRRRRRRRAEVGDEIGNREVHLVADGRHDRHRATRRSRARRGSSIERHEILGRPAAAPEDDHVDARHARRCMRRAVGDLGGGARLPAPASAGSRRCDVRMPPR